MSWADFMAIIKTEAGDEPAARVERRILSELRGVRVTIGVRAPLTDAEVQHALRQARYSVTRAAALLGVAPITVYRALNRKLQPKRPPPGPTPRLIR